MRKAFLCSLFLALPLLGAVVIDDSFESAADWQLNGSAVHVDENLQLTQNSGSLAGSAFFTTPIQIDGEFTVEFEFEMVPQLGTCDADGMTFVVMDAAAGTSFLGGLGGYMGLAGANSIYKTLTIEFDNWVDGTWLANPYDRGLENHVGVGFHPRGLGAYNPRSQFIVDPVTLGAPDFEYADAATPSGMWYCKFVFNHGHFRLYLENYDAAWGPELVLEGTLLNYVPWEPFGEAIIGFTAGTGGCVVQHEVHSIRLSIPETPRQAPYHFTCNGLPAGAGVFLDWEGPATSLLRDGTPVNIAGGPPITDAVASGVYYYTLAGATGEPITCRILYQSDPGDEFSIFSVEEDFEGFLDSETWLLVGSAQQVGGRIQLTPAANSQAGFLILNQPFFTEKFRIEFDFEFANSTNIWPGQSPADGLGVLFVPTGQAEGVPGWPGGNVGQAGQGFGPFLGLEVDNWWNGDAMDGPRWPAGHVNYGENGCRDHVGVNYTSNPYGFITYDAFQNTQPNFLAWGVPADYGMAPRFHGSGVWRFVADIESGVVSIKLTDPDGVTAEVLNRTIPNFIPFTGYLGFCASTGGRNQEHWIDNLVLKVTKPFAPVDFQIAVADNNVRLTWVNQYTYTSMRLLRNGVQIADQSNFTNNAQRYDDLNVPGGAYSYMLEVSYAGQTSMVGGDCEVRPLNISPRLTADGRIRTWLLLGPYSQSLFPTGNEAAPGYDMLAGDWLTDGILAEEDVVPRAGDQVNTDYQFPLGGGASLAYGLATTPGNPALNPGGIPTWYLWQDADGTIAYEDVHGGDLNNIMNYAVCYIHNSTGQQQDVFCGFGSDDSILVRVNGEEVHYHNQPRGSGGVIQNAACLPLRPGMNTIMTKTFEGGGGFNFTFRMQDIDGNPIAFDMPFSYHVDPDEPGGTIDVATTNGRDFTFTANVTGAVASYAWDFDASDGLHQAASGQSVSHVYSANGTYIVTCVVTDTSARRAVLHAQAVVTGTVAPQIAPVRPNPDVAFQNVSYTRQLRLEGGVTTQWSVATTPAGLGAAIDADGMLTLPAGAATGQVQFAVTATNASGSDTETFAVSFVINEFADEFADDPLSNPLWIFDQPFDGENIDISHDAGSETFVINAFTGTPDYDIWCGFDRSVKLLRPVTGDFAMEVKVTMLNDGVGRYRHPGLMVLFDEQPATVDAFLYGFIRNGVRMERVCGYDGMVSGETTEVVDRGLMPPYDGWFRIERVGSAYSFSYKLDEADPWIAHYSTQLAAQPLYAGIYFKNWGDNATSVAFDDFVMRPASTVIGDLACTATEGQVAMTWEEVAGATAVRIFRDILYDGIPFEQIGTAVPGAGAYSDTPPVADYAIINYRVEVDYAGSTSHQTCAVGVTAPGWVAFHDGLAPTPDYNGTQDAHIVLYRSGINEWNTGADAAIETGGWDPLTLIDYKHFLMKWDVSALAGQNVTEARISLHYWYQRNGAVAPAPHTIFAAEVLRDWNQGRGTGIDGLPALCGEVSWQSAARYVEPWQVPGAFGVTDVGAVVAEHDLDPSAQYRAVWEGEPLAPLVQKWIDNPGSNHGLKFAAPSDGDMNNAAASYPPGSYVFVSSDYAAAAWPRPALIVNTGESAGVGILLGDANGDGSVNIADAIYVLAYLFASGPAPLCAKAADPNNDNAINIADAINVLGFLFAQGTMTGADGRAISGASSCVFYQGLDTSVLINGLPYCTNQCSP